MIVAAAHLCPGRLATKYLTSGKDMWALQLLPAIFSIFRRCSCSTWSVSFPSQTPVSDYEYIYPPTRLHRPTERSASSLEAVCCNAVKPGFSQPDPSWQGPPISGSLCVSSQLSAQGSSRRRIVKASHTVNFSSRSDVAPVVGAPRA